MEVDDPCYIVVYINDEAVYSSFVRHDAAIKESLTKEQEFKSLYPYSKILVKIEKKEPFLGW